MNAVEALDPAESRLTTALHELREIILSHYPQATFRVRHGDDPAGVYLVVNVDVEDLTDVLYVVLDRIVDLQVDEGLPIELVPVRPARRDVSSRRSDLTLQAHGTALLDDEP